MNHPTHELDDRVAAVVQRVRIFDVLSQRGHEAARKTGATFHYHCPLPGHEDRNPSFQLKDDRWRCFSQCATGGDVIDLVVALDRCSKADAIEQLARGIGLGRDNQRRSMTQDEVLHPTAKASMADSELLDTFVEKRGWSRTAAQEAGLHIVRYRGRVVVRFPYRIDGAVVWHQDRALDETEPKWCGAPGEAALYNADALRLTDERGGVWLLEGPADCLALQSTFENPAAVAVPGVAGFKARWARAFAGIVVYVVADRDAAGDRLRARCDELLGPVATTVLHVRVPEPFGDLDDWRRGCDCDNDRFSEALLNAVIEAERFRSAA